MARLSNDPVKDSPAVPAGRSSRLKRIFKHRQSSNPKALVKLSSIDCPVVSPTTQPGFEAVGLLPSERGSLENATHSTDNDAGKASELVVAQDMHKIRPIDVSYNLDAGLGVMAASHTDEVVKRVAEDDRVEQERCAQRSFMKALLNCQNEHGDGRVDVAESSEIPIAGRISAKTIPRMDTRGCSPGEFSSQNQAETELHLSREVSRSDNTFVTVASDQHSRDNMPFTFNTFDKDDLLSQDIRDYVTMQIQEALGELLREIRRFRTARDLRKTPTDVELGFPPVIFAKNLIKIMFLQGSSQVSLSTGPKRIGPLAIGHARIANYLQFAILTVYLAIVLVASYMGPEEFVLAIWRLFVFVSLYGLSLHHFGWTNNTEDEIVLAPVRFLIHGVQKPARETSDGLQKSETTDHQPATISPSSGK